ISRIEPTESFEPRQVESLKAQLLADPYQVPPIVVEFTEVDAKGLDRVMVLDGHNRLEAARQLGVTKIPVKLYVSPDDWDKVQQAGGMRIAGTEAMKKTGASYDQLEEALSEAEGDLASVQEVLSQYNADL